MTVLEMIRTPSGTYVPALPDTAYGAGGLTDRDRHWMKMPPPAPSVGGNPAFKRFESPPWSDPNDGWRYGPSGYRPRMRPPTFSEFFKRGLPRAVNPLMRAIDFAEFLGELAGGEVIEPNWYWQPWTDEPTQWFNRPPGLKIGCTEGGWMPGRMLSSYGYYSRDESGHFDGLVACGTIKEEPPLPGFAESPPALSEYLAFYSAQKNHGSSEWRNAQRLPWFSFEPLVPGELPEKLPVYIGHSPNPSVVPDPIVTGGAAVPIPLGSPQHRVPPLIRALDPGAVSPLQESGVRPHVPYRLLPHLRSIPDVRTRANDPPGEDIGRVPYNPDDPLTGAPIKPPVPPRPNPSRPAPGEKEKKAWWKAKAPQLLEMAKKAMDNTTETCDAVDAIWSALPGDVKWVPGQPQACGEKALAIVRHWNKIDIGQAVTNLVINHYGDKVVGGLMRARQDALGRLGTRGWRMPIGPQF